MISPARFGLAVLIVVLLVGKAQARERETGVLPGITLLRNGDWFALGALGFVELDPAKEGRLVAATARAEVGIGGAGASVGMAAGMLPGPCNPGSLFGVEARAERTWGPTGWRSAAYVGPQLSYSVTILKVSLAWMFDVEERSDNHVQLGVGVGF